jgi:hypothetical protein
MTGVVETDSFYFLFDESVEPFRGPAAVDFENEDWRFPADALPDLERAPIASWIVARLAFLTGGGLGFQELEGQSVDGGSCCLEPSVFTRERRHVGSLQIQADSEIAVFGTFDGSVSPASVLDELAAKLLAEPAAVKVIAVRVRDSEGGSSRSYGFDGKRFRGRRGRRSERGE